MLKEIASADGHVLTFHPFEPQANGSLRLHRRGWNQASTFDAFCDKHDSATFALLEAVPFAGTKEQIFLTAYRAICWELYQKARAVKSGSTLRDLVDRGASEASQKMIQELLAVQAAGFQKGLADLREGKQRMDKALIGSDYSDFSAYELRLEGPLALASTGAITPNRTLAGEVLQTLHNPAAQTQWLAFGLDLKGNGASFVFGWRRGELAPARYISEVMALEGGRLAEFLFQFPFAHCENTYFKEEWWETLSTEDRGFLERLMANSNPYYDPPEYQLDRGIAPWRVTSHGEVSL